MLSKPEFPYILFVVAGLLFAWPLMEVYRQFSPLGRLFYFFGIWATVVLVYFFMSKKVG
ncbi:hypothetical protein [Motiliproteus sp. MSK22-1]|uniref:hypothetical protein n=1 Tax=Motiliproteus sp. MSK22-1 TaxID=1897630 RepID=UPI0013012BF4|nr:hypothetical protein [Motiliproteus sp. MSK22-1]